MHAKRRSQTITLHRSTAGKALRSLQDIGLIERFVARRKETLISVYGTDGKPIQPR